MPLLQFFGEWAQRLREGESSGICDILDNNLLTTEEIRILKEALLCQRVQS